MAGVNKQRELTAVLKLRERLERQQALIDAYCSADEAVAETAGAARDAMAAHEAAIARRREALAAVAVNLSDDRETARVLNVSMREVGDARRSVSGRPGRANGPRPRPE